MSDYGQKFYDLNKDVQMPAIGFGTLRLNNEEIVHQTINDALEAGYRLFDTASIHGNERLIGITLENVLREHNLTRENIFITTKLSPACCDPKHVNRAFYRSLDNLKTDYVDLYLIHFPAPTLFPNKQVLQNSELRIGIWKCLINLYKHGKVRAIGVSNFTVQHLQELIDNTSEIPMINQVEWHPYFHNMEMLEFCRRHNIQLQAFCSFGGVSRGDPQILGEGILQNIARNHDVSTYQVLLAWALHRDVAVIPKSKDPDHMVQNRRIDFTLSDAELAAIDSLGDRKLNYRRDPADII